MIKNFRNKLVAAVGIASTAVVGSSAFAAAADMTAVTASISDAATAGGVIGLAVLGMYFGLKLYKWVKQAG